MTWMRTINSTKAKYFKDDRTMRAPLTVEIIEFGRNIVRKVNINLFLTPLNPKQRYHATDKPVFGSGREVSCLSQNI